MPLSASDVELLERCLHLAEQAPGSTSPNPMVGALVFRDGAIVGEGFHERAGADHAEIAAMKSAGAGELAGGLAGSTIYVSLEPCCHYGRTPPCTEALIRAGVERVVVAATDPSERVNGRGIERLREAGITVDVADGDVERRAQRQNGPFRKRATRGLPFFTYKYAMTLDGRVATESGDSRWISGEASRESVHRLRARSDAVLVGAGTLLKDDSMLTARGVGAFRQPLRVVIDHELALRQQSRLVSSLADGPVLVFCSEEAAAARGAEVTAWGVQVETLPPAPAGGLDLLEAARLLAARDVQSVLVEGGPTLAASLWDAGLIDKVLSFVAPVLAGGRHAPGPLPAESCGLMSRALRLQDVEIVELAGDVLVSGYVGEPY